MNIFFHNAKEHLAMTLSCMKQLTPAPWSMHTLSLCNIEREMMLSSQIPPQCIGFANGNAH